MTRAEMLDYAVENGVEGVNSSMKKGRYFSGTPEDRFMIYASYEFYSYVYFGKAIEPVDFPRLALRASSYLDWCTAGRAAKHADLEAVKMACCALAEDYQTIDSARMLANRNLSSASGDSGELQSQTVGNCPKPIVPEGQAAKDALNAAESAQGVLMETAKMYLAGLGF